MKKENKLTNENNSNNITNNNKNQQKKASLNVEKDKNDNNNNVTLETNNNQKNKYETKLKYLKLLFNENNTNIEEQKEDDNEKIFFETLTDFHRARLPKIKFRNNGNIVQEIKEEKIVENKEDDNLNENLNINKEKKKNKKIIKKKVKKKKKKVKKEEENNEQYETSIEKLDGEETSIQEEKLSKSLQERKIDNKNIIDLIETGGKIKNNEKEKEKEEKNEKDIIKDNNKEKEIKMGKKEIIKKLIKYSGNKKIFQLNLKPKLNLANIQNIKGKINKVDNNEKIIENKDISLIKREQIMNAKLVNNNSLSSKERIRREQLEKDLENEINNDDLSDEPYEETEIDLNKNEEEFKSHSTNKRKIKNKEKIEKNETERNFKFKKLSNSLKTRKKIYNLKSYKKFKLVIENRIYTPKKAIMSRESSKRKMMEFSRNTNSKINTIANLDNHNVFITDFNKKDHNIKTRFKVFNENNKKDNKKKFQPKNINKNITLDFNHPKSIEILSSINNYKNINGLKKVNLRNNTKLLYIKKSPTREKDDKTNINNNDYNTFNNINANNNLNNINYLNKNKYKKILTNKIINDRINKTNIPLTDRDISNDYNYQLLKESKNINNTNNANNTKNNNYIMNPNNILPINKNIKLNGNTNNSFTFRKHIKILNPLNAPIPTINLEDFILIENKFFNIIHNLGEKKDISNDCFDLFNFYYNCSLYQGILAFFSDTNIIKLNINYTLMSLLITYDLSFNKPKLKKIYLLLLEMFLSNYRNLMLIIEYVINKTNINNENKFWIKKLTNKINKYKESQEGEEIDSYNNFGLTIIEKIKYNTHYLMQKIHYILLNYDNNNSNNNNDLLFFLKTINANSYDKINVFFKENILRENYDFSSLLASSLIKNNLLSNKIHPNQPPTPYISFPCKKKYTLVLDLDETLIYFDKVKDVKDDSGTFKIRPGTFTFLEKVQKFYEIVIFSEAEQNYVDLILSSIEENKKYFDFVLYRQHTTIQNEEFIKDLSKIGRKLSKIIIVDNMPQNFRLQPENGIYIKPFWGDNNEDEALFNLSDILCKIANNIGDLREGIKKYKNEIIINVSCCFKDS